MLLLRVWLCCWCHREPGEAGGEEAPTPQQVSPSFLVSPRGPVSFPVPPATLRGPSPGHLVPSVSHLPKKHSMCDPVTADTHAHSCDHPFTHSCALARSHTHTQPRARSHTCTPQRTHADAHNTYSLTHIRLRAVHAHTPWATPLTLSVSHSLPSLTVFSLSLPD